MKNNDTHNCPDFNVLAEFVEGKIVQSEHKDIFLHIANCPICKDFCAFAAKERAKYITGKETKVSKKVQKEVLQEISALRGDDVQSVIAKAWNIFLFRIQSVLDSLEHAEVIAASEVHSILVFSSVPGNSAKSWKMCLKIPLQIEKFLQIELNTSKNDKVDGQLVLCGNIVMIKNGVGVIEYEVLRKSFSNPEIAFIFEDGERIIGYPEL